MGFDVEQFRKGPRNADGSYLNEDQIVDHFIRHASKNMHEDLLAIKHRHDLIQLHDSYGRLIRNMYDLWHEENPHTHYGNRYVNRETGIADHPNHADQMSMRILERVWVIARSIVAEKDIGCYFCPYAPQDEPGSKSNWKDMVDDDTDEDRIWEAVKETSRGY